MTSRRRAVQNEEESTAAKTAKMEIVEFDDYGAIPIFEVDMKEDYPAMFNFVDVNNYTEPTGNEANSKQTKPSTQAQKPNIVPSTSNKALKTPVIIKPSDIKLKQPIRFNIIAPESVPPLSKISTLSSSNTQINSKMKILNVMQSISNSNVVNFPNVANKPNIIIQKAFPMVTKSTEDSGNNPGKCSENCHENSKFVAEMMQKMMNKMDKFEKDTDRRLTVQNMLINKLIKQNEKLLQNTQDDNTLDASTELDELLKTVKLPKQPLFSSKTLTKPSILNKITSKLHPQEAKETSNESTNEKIEALTNQISDLQKEIRQMRKLLNDIVFPNKTAEKYNEPIVFSLPNKSTYSPRDQCVYKGPISSIVELEKVNKDMLDSKLREHYIAYLHQKTRVGDQLGKIFFKIMTRECLYLFNYYKSYQATGSSKTEALYPTYLHWLHALQDALELSEDDLATSIQEICILNRKHINDKNNEYSTSGF